MKLAVRSLMVLVLLVVAAGVVARATADERAQGAAATLDRAASRFASCYDATGSYSTCTSGSPKVAVAQRERGTFTLVMDAGLAATLTVAGGRGHAPIRTCVAHGAECPQGWRRVEGGRGA